MSEEQEEAPFHVLMATSARPLQELLVRHDSLKNDYLARRYRTLHKDECETTMWSASLPCERAMIECCQLSNEDDAMIVGGALQKKREQEFVRLLALHCHTAASRALALAILQKTIEQDELETPIIEEVDDADVMMVDAEEPKDVKSEVDADTKPPAHEEPLKVSSSSDNITSQDNVDNGRMGRFLEAGGLSILKQWFVDAMTPVKIVVTKPAPPPQQGQTATTNKKPQKVIQTTASPTGPLLLPLLQILTEMPFDKQLVMSVKINKQIRRLKKQLDEAIALRTSQRANDLKWTDPVAGGLVVEKVKNAVVALMESWKEKSSNNNKSTSLATQDVFTSLQSKMKEQLELLKNYEIGESEKPDFLAKFEEQERRAKEAEEVSKLTTEQRATRERQQEKEQMLKMAQKRQAELREKVLALKKRKDEGKSTSQVEKKRKTTCRRVRWKDGFDNADNVRRRNLLEQVHVYTKESDFDEYDEAVKQEEESAVKQDPDEEGVAVKQEPDEDDDDGIPFADDSDSC